MRHSLVHTYVRKKWDGPVRDACSTNMFRSSASFGIGAWRLLGVCGYVEKFLFGDVFTEYIYFTLEQGEAQKGVNNGLQLSSQRRRA